MKAQMPSGGCLNTLFLNFAHSGGASIIFGRPAKSMLLYFVALTVYSSGSSIPE